MAHRITAILLKGKYIEEKLSQYDLRPVQLESDLTMFFINHYYTEYWQYKIFKERSNLDLDLTLYPIIFPLEKVLSFIMKEISLENALFTIIHTDYFGGIGEQYACIFEGYINLDKSIKSINDALKLLGVKRKGSFDEFDSIGLSDYRSEPDYLNKYFDLVDDLDF